MHSLREAGLHLLYSCLFPPSVLDACWAFLQSPEPTDAVVTLWRMETLAQHMLILLAGELLSGEGLIGPRPFPELSWSRDGWMPLSYSWAQLQPSCLVP